jgi:hypothetical protein
VRIKSIDYKNQILPATSARAAAIFRKRGQVARRSIAMLTNSAILILYYQCEIPSVDPFRESDINYCRKRTRIADMTKENLQATAERMGYPMSSISA